MIYKKIKYIVRYVFVLLNYYLSRKSGVTDTKYDNPLVVSLTSYPMRYGDIHLCITTLLSQTLKPNKLILWIAEDQKPDNRYLKKWEKLKKRGLEIRYLKEDIKSYKKLIYSLREYPEASVITVDDDILYPNNLIESLYKKHLEMPTSIIGTRGTTMIMSSDTVFAKYSTWPVCNDQVASYSNFLTGVGGILYPSGSLDSEVDNVDALLELAPRADDIWFKAMSLKAGTKVVVLKFDENKLIPIHKVQESSLHSVNVGKELNDIQLKAVFDRYNLYKKVYNEK